MNKILAEDVEDVVDRLGKDVEKFHGKTVLITGATGLIGSLLARVFMLLNEMKSDVKIILVARSKERIEEVFGENIEEKVKVVVQEDIAQKIEVEDEVDYIIHTASPANSRYYTEKPVETIEAIFGGGEMILRLAKEKKVEKVVIMSSMEAYGDYDKESATEDEHGFIDLCNARNSYLVGKRAVEFEAFAYFREYGVPAVSVRLAMCFGPGQKKDDRRVHRAFCEAALNGRNVEVKSSGETKINFVYSADAILAILILLIKGKAGETYNVAGDAKGWTILDMAQYVAKANGVKMCYVVDKSEAERFAKDSLMTLNIEKMISLGWKWNYDIEEALNRYMDFLRDTG